MSVLPAATFRPVRTLLLGATLALATGCATFAEYDDDQKFGLGIRGELPMTRVISPEGRMSGATASRLEVHGSLHRFTPGDATLVVANGDVVLPLIPLADGAARLYTGAGVHLGRISSDGDDDGNLKVGANLLGGLRFEHRRVSPFFEVRGGAGGYSSLSALAGVRFLSR